MHPLEVSICYVVIAVALAVYLGRGRGTGRDLKPGDSFTVVKPFVILAGVMFIGLPAYLIYILPEAAHRTAATAIVIPIAILFATAFFLLLGCRIEITQEGLASRVYRWRSSCRLADYKSVSIERYYITLSPKDPSQRPFVFPAFYQKIGKIHDYVKFKIEQAEGTAERSKEVPNQSSQPTRSARG